MFVILKREFDGRRQGLVDPAECRPGITRWNDDGVAAITHASGKQMPGSFEVQ